MSSYSVRSSSVPEIDHDDLAQVGDAAQRVDDALQARAVQLGVAGTAARARSGGCGCGAAARASSRRQSGRPRRWSVRDRAALVEVRHGAEPRSRVGDGSTAVSVELGRELTPPHVVVRRASEQLGSSRARRSAAARRGSISMNSIPTSVEIASISVDQITRPDRDDGVLAEVERHAQHVAEVDLAADRLEADAARGHVAAHAEQVARRRPARTRSPGRSRCAGTCGARPPGSPLTAAITAAGAHRPRRPERAAL